MKFILLHFYCNENRRWQRLSIRGSQETFSYHRSCLFEFLLGLDKALVEPNLFSEFIKFTLFIKYKFLCQL